LIFISQSQVLAENTQIKAAKQHQGVFSLQLLPRSAEQQLSHPVFSSNSTA
jgi:hypothetical protein